MNARKLFAALLVGSMLWGLSASAEVRYKTYTLFGGSNVDTLEQASAWIPVERAKRVYIKTWTTKAAFHASTDADSTFSDSLIAFRVLVSDSLFGVIAGPGGQTTVSAADSVILPVTAAGDTAGIMLGAMPLPVNKPLRAPATGTGRLTVVYPTQPGVATTAAMIDLNGHIMKKYLRVLCIPLRRNTVTGGNSTTGKRVVGLKGFKMVAIVVTEEN